MDFNNLIIKKDGNLCMLSINRTKFLNCLNTETFLELGKAMDLIAEDEEIHVVVITGEGRAFVAGADISEMMDKDPELARKFAQLSLGVFRKIELLEKPVIAAVNGYCLGGGNELAMCCDFVIAADNAKFGQPEITLGIIPGSAGTQRLPRLVGRNKAKELIFTGDIFDANEALRIGLINRVVPKENLMEEVLALANKIISRPQLAVRYAKNAINRGIETDLETGMAIERELFGLCFATKDQKEGMAAFLEKENQNLQINKGY